jgi:alpha-tubulin suppressor-like RCC1 family protein
MAALNLTNLENLINCRINQTTALCDAQSILVNAVSAGQWPNVVDSVFQVKDLPDIYANNLPNGHLIYVSSLNDFVISSNGSWVNFNKVIIRDDQLTNTVYSWGDDIQGVLGDNDTIAKSSPVSVVGGFTDWCQVSVGCRVVSAIKADGTLWTWGSNSSGQLGHGTATTCSRSSPVSVVGGFTDWCQVSAGYGHAAAIRTNGTLWTWGRNNGGQLGDNTVIDKSSPVSVVGGFTDWCQVSVGLNLSAAAIRTNGTLWSWGSNSFGMLGDNTTVAKSSPVSVVGGFTDWCQVNSGCRHIAAIRTNGTLWTWGLNTRGQLGDNTTNGRSSPVSVVGVFTDWCQVSAGGYHTSAVRTDGTLWSWGSNSYSQLGDNSATSASKSSPVSVVGGFTNWCQVSSGFAHTAAIRNDGTLWTWGLNNCGQLGHGTALTCSRASPVSVAGGFNNWCQISARSCLNSAIRVSFS